MNLLWADTESFSDTPIECGVHQYARTARIDVSAWALNDEPARAVAGVPAEFVELLHRPDVLIVFHNAAWDRTVLRIAHGIDIPIGRVRCSMAQAMAHGLPGGLDKLGDIFGLREDEKKLKEGKALMRLFCIPRMLKGVRQPLATPESHPAEWARFLEYARMDVEAMRTIVKKLPAWNYPANPTERRVWELDQKINDRGVAVDVPLARAVVAAVDRAKATAAVQVAEATEGRVASVNQRDKMLAELLAQHGVALPDMRADTLERRLNDQSLPEVVRELIALRLEISQTSTSKYTKLLQYAGPDARVRGTLQFCGAQRTGRWAGRGPQLHNLVRPSMKQDAIALLIEAFLADCADLVDARVTTCATNVLRGVFVAEEGNQISAADLANIEGRKLAYLAGEQWKLDAFRAFDAGTGPDLYKASYARSFDIDASEISDDDPRRQVGKVLELSMGYAGGVGAFCAMALVYGLDLDKLAADAMHALPADIVEEATGFWDWAVRKHRTLGLARETFIALDGLKRAWRRAHPETVNFWADVEDAARLALRYPGRVTHARDLQFDMVGAWLRMRLPSGRFVCYPGARLDEKDEAISYLGVNQYTRQWGRIRTYSGKLVENAVQAASRDVLAEGMLRADDTGYCLVLDVHDEVVCEEPILSGRNAAGLAACMTAPIEWAPGIPLAAKGFDARRYRK